MLVNWIASIASVFFLAMGWYCRCCKSDCSDCNANETPATIEAIVTGFVNAQCTDASSINGTHVLTQLSPCDYRFISASESASHWWNGTHCVSRRVIVSFTLADLGTTITITIGNDIFSYSDTVLTYGDCCSSDLASPVDIPFLSQITTNPAFGHDGSSSTVSVRCLT